MSKEFSLPPPPKKSLLKEQHFTKGNRDYFRILLNIFKIIIF